MLRVARDWSGHPSKGPGASTKATPAAISHSYFGVRVRVAPASPAPLAQALKIEKGEVIEWVVEDKHTLTLRRPSVALTRRRKHA